MAELSDGLLVVTLLAYLVAMLLHAAEYAFGARGRIANAAVAPAALAGEGTGRRGRTRRREPRTPTRLRP